MPKVLVLSTCTSHSMLVLWCLREAGYNSSVVIGNSSKNRDLRFSPLCKTLYEIPDSYTVEKKSPEIINYIKKVAERENIDIIIPSGFESLKFLSEYKKDLTGKTRILSVPSLEMIENLGNKHSFSLFCQKESIPHPRTYLVNNMSDIKEKRGLMNFPVMLKPVALSNSEGLRRFNDKNELNSYFLNNNKHFFPSILQDFIPGQDIGFNAFATNGELNAWAIQHWIEIPRKGKEPIKWLQYSKNDEVFNIGKMIIQKSLYSGPVNIDLRLDSRDKSVKALEVNPRFWATTFYSICDGVNFVDVGIKSTFCPKFKIKPRYSNSIWGTPHRIPFLILRYRTSTFFKLIFNHSLFQIKYILMKILFNLITAVKNLIFKYRDINTILEKGT